MSHWTMDMNRCNQCPKCATCPDKTMIHKATHALTGVLIDNKDGSRAGMLVLVCREPELMRQENAENKV